MKMAKKLLAACMLGLGLVAMGCNGDGDGGLGPAPSNDELIGTWYLREVATKGTITMKFPPLFDTTINIDTVETYTGTTYYIEFKADKTYVTNSPDSDVTPDFEFEFEKRSAGSVQETGTWSLSGSTLTLNADPSGGDEGYTLEQTVALNAGTLTMQAVVDTSVTEEESTFATKLRTTAKLVK